MGRSKRSSVSKCAADRGSAVTRLVGVFAALVILAGGLYWLRGYQKQVAARNALVRGTQAYDAKNYGEAAAELGRYLVVDGTNVEVLWKYADSQLRRRPESTDTFRQAISALSTVLRNQPGHARASETLADLRLNMGMPADAATIATARLKVAPGDETATRQLALALQRQNKLDEAIEKLSPLAKQGSNRIDDSTRLAHMYLEKKDPETAMKLMEELVRDNPKSARARIAFVHHLFSVKDQGRMEQELGTLENSPPADPEETVRLGLLLFTVGRPEKALAQLDGIKKVNSPVTAAYLAQFFLTRDDFARAARWTDRSLPDLKYEDRFDFLPSAVEIYAGAGRAADAADCTKEYREAGGPARTVQYLEAITALAEGKTDDGIAKLQDLASRDPKHAKVNDTLGWAYANTGRPREAAASFERHRTAGYPLNAKGLTKLAEIYTSLGDWAKAEEAADEANRAAPGSPTVQLISINARATRERLSGQPSPTTLKRLAEEAKSLAMRFPTEARPRILAARITAWSGGTKEAIDDLVEASKTFNNSVDVLAAIGEIHAESEDFAKAVEAYEQAAKTASPAIKQALAPRLAELHLAAGHTDKAIEVAKAAVASSPSGPDQSAARLRLAALMAEAKQFDQAREELVRLIADDNPNVPARLMLLQMGPAAGKSPTPDELIGQIKRIEGESGVNWRYWQARTLLQQANWAENRKDIEALLQECRSKAPDREDVVLAIGLLHEKANDTRKAIDTYREFLDANPRSAGVAMQLLTLANRTAQYRESDDRFLRAISSKNSIVHYYRVALAMRRGDIRQAERILDDLLRQTPTDVGALTRRAMLLIGRDDARAEQLFNKAATIAPDSQDVLAARVGFLLSLTQHKQAMELCSTAIAKAASPWLYRLRATVHIKSQDWDAAAVDLRETAKAPEWAEDALGALGQMYLQAGDKDKAVATWREGLAKAPTSLILRAAIASVLLMGEKPEQKTEAVTILEQMLKESPDNEWALLLHGDSLRSQDPTKAKEAYENATRVATAGTDAYLRLANLALDENHPTQALDWIDRGLAKNQGDARLLMMKCRSLMGTSADEATIAAKKAYAAQPDSDTAILLADALAKAGHEDLAIEHLTKFVASRPKAKPLQAQYALAILLRDSNRTAEADAQLRDAESQPADDPNTFRTMLMAYGQKQDFEKCHGLAQEWRQKNPRDVYTAHQAAQILAASSEPKHQQAAAAFLEHVIRQDPNNVEGYADLGKVLRDLGRTEDATKAMTQGLQKAPSDPRLPERFRLLNDLAWVRCEDLQQPQEAEKLAGEAIRANVDHPKLLDTWGVIQYRLGKLDESRKSLEKCIAHRDVEPDTKVAATFHLARTVSNSDPKRAYELLKNLTEDQRKQLPPADQKEVERMMAAGEKAASKPA